MFSKTSTYKSTKTSSGETVSKAFSTQTKTADKILQLKNEIETADAIVVGAGAGLSTSAGMSYSGERFEKYFSDFHRKYGITDMYSGGFYPFDTLEEYWAWWSRHILVNRYEAGIGKPYIDLLELVKDKDYFVLTTNVDHQFQLAGFDKKRLFYTQGDYGLWQCSKPCHDRTYDNEEAVRQMAAEQKDMKIPTELVPRCPICGAPMNVNLRCDDTFVEDEGWHKAAERYNDFIRRHENLHILFLELGVGANTPVIIKYPFWRMTARNPKAVYACINKGEAMCPREIRNQSICIDGDIAKTLSHIHSFSKVNPAFRRNA
ncbi:MAG: Sir2 silent information regulator family NAD-dependent deacetylase [Oscillospiraceae bacterium]|nr:Sir2 silent information regulator family NAD-dependent deacetylase [Oscillospiraceae bacterium]